MSDPSPATRATAGTVLRALRQTRQVRQFTPEPVAEADLQAVLEVARWSGSERARPIPAGNPPGLNAVSISAHSDRAEKIAQLLGPTSGTTGEPMERQV